MKKILHVIVLLSLVLTCAPFSSAQNKKANTSQPVTVYGSVKSTKGIPLQGVEVTVQDSFTKTSTDETGDFSIETTIGSVLVFSTEYFNDSFITVTSKDRIQVLMEEAPIGASSRDNIMMPYGMTKKRNVTGSIASISGEELSQTKKAPIGSGLSGLVMGLTARTSTGAPGYDESTFLVRGVRSLAKAGTNSVTFNSVCEPLILVDGFERDFTNLNPDEIESLSILKDAASTAIYGQRAANGVILVTTKRGQTNKRTIDFKYNYGLLTPTDCLPDYVDAATYAEWYNEARRNDGYADIYTPDDIELYKNQKSPWTHPDVNYMDECLKDMAAQHQASLSMAGGNRNARYFVSLGYLNQGSLYNTFPGMNPDFQSPSSYNRYNVRANADVNLTNWLTFSMDVSGRIEERDVPKMSSSTLFNTFHTPANQFPLYFYGMEPSLKKEILMIGGNSVYQTNPFALLAWCGEALHTKRYFQVTAKFDADLETITKGLSAEAYVNLDGYGSYDVEKGRTYSVWQYTEDFEKNPVYTQYGTDGTLSTSSDYDIKRYLGFGGKLKYDRQWGSHSFNSMAYFDYRTIQVRLNNQSDYKYEDMGIWASYNFRQKYYIDFTGDISGSDKYYYTDHRRVFMPTVGASWIISSEDFMKGAKWINYLKLKASYGITGNCNYDFLDLAGTAEERYPARVRYWVTTSGNYFGTSLTSVDITREGRMANPDIDLEKSAMANVALEGSLFNNRLYFDAEAWHDHRYNIFANAVGTFPKLIGVFDGNMPITNTGIVNSKGIEFMLDWNDKIGDFSYGIGGYFTKMTSKIMDMGEPYRAYDNLVQTGNRVGDSYGLHCVGLFQDQADIDNSPEQRFGVVQPGDLKYADINGDGFVDTNDFIRLEGTNNQPLTNFAFHFMVGYKNLSLSAYIQGATDVTSYLSMDSMRAFYDNGSAQYFMEGRFRTFEDGTTNAATATYPRFTTMANDNNWRASDYWFYDTSYLRLKNVELSYTLPQKMTRKSSIDKARIYINGNNLYCWSYVKKFHIDPEDHGAGHDSYPMTKLFNVGIDLSF